MSARTDYVSALFHAMAAWPCASVTSRRVGMSARTDYVAHFSMQWQPGPVRR